MVGLMVELRQHLVLIACMFLIAGCDPVRTTSQTVRLRISKAGSGEAVGNIQVSLKYDFETAEPLSKETRQPPKEWHDHMQKFWDNFPWRTAETDQRGEASVDLVYSVLDRTWGSTPPPERDEATAKPYLVWIKAGKSSEEKLRLLLKPGETRS